MANKRNEPKTVPSYVEHKSGALHKGVGYSIRDGWTNPDKDKLLKKAGYFNTKNGKVC